LADAKGAPHHVVAYQIVGINCMEANNDLKSITAAGKIAQVEVEVTFACKGTDRRSVVNIEFVFLREGGKWYKS
jgi:hypothetical protein